MRPADAQRIRAVCSWEPFRHASRVSERVILCSPPGPNGAPSDIVLAAAELAGVSEVYAIGGAGAIAAMAYGTQTIAPVRRIVGPGNAYVAEAKLQVSNVTGIDSPAGPSELLVIADDSASSESVAREVLAQAEHDPRAAVVVLAHSDRAAREIGRRYRGRFSRTSRVARSSRNRLRRAGLCSGATRSSTRSRSRTSTRPSIFCSPCAIPDAALEQIRNAGTVFLGEHKLGRVRRLHDGRESRAAHRRACALVLGLVDARLRALDDVSTRVVRGGARARAERGDAGGGRRSAGACRGRATRGGGERPERWRARCAIACLRARMTLREPLALRAEPRALRARPQRQHESLGRAAHRPSARSGAWTPNG